jgi:hypothetical protein
MMGLLPIELSQLYHNEKDMATCALPSPILSPPHLHKSSEKQLVHALLRLDISLQVLLQWFSAVFILR